MTKRLIFQTLAPALATALVVSTAARAQPTTVPPARAFARPAARAAVLDADTATTRFTVNGLTVILRRNTASDIVAANLYLLGGTRQVTPQTAGIEPFLLAVSERGTRRFPHGAAESEMANLGSIVGINPTPDWTSLEMQTVRSALDSSWAILADRIMAPTVDSTDVELVRAQLLAGTRQERTAPDAEARRIADSLTYEGHPYAIDPGGTERSLSAITAADLRRYAREQMVTSRMLLVVVGNVDRNHVESLVRGTLATLPVGSYRWTAPVPPPIRPGSAAIVARSLPTNYILGYYVGPPAASADYPALRIASAILSGSLFSEIRTKRKLSYAADAPFIDQAIATGGVYVTTVAPDTSIAVMQREIGLLKAVTLDDEELGRLVQRFITDYYMRNERNADKATALARAELYEGDYRAAQRFVDNLRRVSPEDVRRVAQRYMRNFHFAYIGDPSSVNARELQRF